MVFHVAVGREQGSIGGRSHAQRHLLLAVVDGGDENARRVELVASQFGHQARAGAVPQPPADQFLDGGPVVDHLARGILELQVLVAVFLGVDHVGQLGLDLFEPEAAAIDVGPAGRIELFLEVGPPLDQFLCHAIIGLGLRRQGRLPTIAGAVGQARQVHPVPLGPDIVQLAQHAALDRIDRVGVKDVVVPLVAGGQDQARLLGHPGHILAFVYAVGHQLFGDDRQAGLQGGDGRRGVQVQWQGEDHAFELVGLCVGQQFVVAGVDLDVLSRFVFGLPAVLGHQAGPRSGRRLARMIAVERPPHAEGADVGDRLDPDEIGIDRADQNAAFIAGADHTDPQGRTDGLVVAELEAGDPAADDHAGRRGSREEVAARHAAGGRLSGLRTRIQGVGAHTAIVPFSLLGSKTA